MTNFLRCLTTLLASLIWAQTPGEEIHLPMDEGSLIVKAEFIRSGVDRPQPVLNVRIANHTKVPWSLVQLQVHAGGLCDGEVREWDFMISTSVGYASDFAVVHAYRDLRTELEGKVDGCHSEIVQVRIVSATSTPAKRTVGEGAPLPNIGGALVRIKELREGEAAVAAQELALQKARLRQIEAEEAAASESQRVAAEMAFIRAEKEKADERRRLERVCNELFKVTADKRIADLTMRQIQQIDACRALGIYR